MELVYGWVDDDDVEKMFAEKDLKIINELTELLEKTSQRERGVNYVTDRMYKEIEGLDAYLNIMVGNIEKSEDKKDLNN